MGDRPARAAAGPPVPAVLLVRHWGGVSQQAVLIVGHTPKRFRIRALVRTRLSGRGRWLEAGAETLVPHTSVSIIHRTLRDFARDTGAYAVEPGLAAAALRAADAWERREGRSGDSGG